jgi:hypothetical protein
MNIFLVLLLLYLIFKIKTKELFNNINQIIIKSIDNKILDHINIVDYNNINVNNVFKNNPKVKIVIPINFKSEITYKYNDYNKLFAFKIELPEGEHIIERNVKDTSTDKIIIQKRNDNIKISLMLIKDFNGKIIHINELGKPINWEAIRMASKLVKPIYGTNAIVDIYYGTRVRDKTTTE